MKHESSAEDLDNLSEIKKLTYIVHILINAHKKDKEVMNDINTRLVRVESKIDYLPKIIVYGLTIVSAVVSCAVWMIQHYGR